MRESGDGVGSVVERAGVPSNDTVQAAADVQQIGGPDWGRNVKGGPLWITGSPRLEVIKEDCRLKLNLGEDQLMS